MGSWYKQQLNEWVNGLDIKADKLLDLGGSQHPLKGRTKSWDVNEYLIMDLAEPHVTLQLPDIAHDLNQPLDYGTLDELKDYFDWIYCLGVFDYVINPNIAFENIANMLAPGGKAWVEFPFSYCHHNPIEVDGLRFTWPSIVNLAAQANLKIIDHWKRKPRPGNNHLLQYYAEDGMRMAKDFDHNVIGYMVLLEK